MRGCEASTVCATPLRWGGERCAQSVAVGNGGTFQLVCVNKAKIVKISVYFTSTNLLLCTQKFHRKSSIDSDMCSSLVRNSKFHSQQKRGRFGPPSLPHSTVDQFQFLFSSLDHNLIPNAHSRMLCCWSFDLLFWPLLWKKLIAIALSVLHHLYCSHFLLSLKIWFRYSLVSISLHIYSYIRLRQSRTDPLLLSFILIAWKIPPSLSIEHEIYSMYQKEKEKRWFFLKYFVY